LGFVEQPVFMALGLTCNGRSARAVKPVVLPLRAPVAYHHALQGSLLKHGMQELLPETGCQTCCPNNCIQTNLVQYGIKPGLHPLR